MAARMVLANDLQLDNDIAVMLKKYLKDVDAQKRVRYLMGKLMEIYRGHIQGHRIA